MKIVSLSEIGSYRKNNQDAVLVGSDYCAVADGMGGHKAGDIASQMTIKNFVSEMEDFAPDNNSIKALFNSLNLSVYEKQINELDYMGMGTTLTALWFNKNKVWVGHVGDSRCYIIRDGSLNQLTKDHSYINELLDNGIITKNDISSHPFRNVITRAIGINLTIKTDVFSLNPLKGDIYFLCSDGVSSFVTEDDILQTVANVEFVKLPQAIIQKALQNGSNDNLSAVFAIVEEEL